MFIYIQAIHNLEGIPQRVYFKWYSVIRIIREDLLYDTYHLVCMST